MHVAPNAGKSFWLTTDRHTFKLVGADTNGAFTMIEVIARPEFGPPPHIHHRQDECFYVLDGEFEFTYEGRTFTAGAGSVVHLAKGRVHTHRGAGNRPARALNVTTPAAWKNSSRRREHPSRIPPRSRRRLRCRPSRRSSP